MNVSFSKASHLSGNLQRQAGMSMTMVLVVMSVVVFFATFGFKAGPAYFENWTVQKVVSQVAGDAQVMRGTRKGVFKKMNEMLGHNNIWSLKAEDIVVLTKVSTGYTAHLDYERRENLFSNIDLIMRFNTEEEES